MTSFAAIDAKCILDAGRTGIIMLSDRILAPRRHEWLILVPEGQRLLSKILSCNPAKKARLDF